MRSTSAETRAARAARNESLFREINERVEDIATRAGIQERVDLVCECVDLRCAETVAMNADEYESMRASPDRFVVAPGHELPGVERIVERKRGYVIVAKIGTAKRAATDLDPRGASA